MYITMYSVRIYGTSSESRNIPNLGMWIYGSDGINSPRLFFDMPAFPTFTLTH